MVGMILRIVLTVKLAKNGLSEPVFKVVLGIQAADTAGTDKAEVNQDGGVDDMVIDQKAVFDRREGENREPVEDHHRCAKEGGQTGEETDDE